MRLLKRVFCSPIVHKIAPAGALNPLCRSRSRSDAHLVESVTDATMKRSVSGSQLAQLQSAVPEITEERVGIVVSKVIFAGKIFVRCGLLDDCHLQKGWMNFLEGKNKGWTRRWVVIRRPYVLHYRDDKDLVS